MDTAEIIQSIVERGDQLNRADINAVIESVDEPGRSREQKKEAVTELLERTNQLHSAYGEPIIDTLRDWASF